MICCSVKDWTEHGIVNWFNGTLKSTLMTQFVCGSFAAKLGTLEAHTLTHTHTYLPERS